MPLPSYAELTEEGLPSYDEVAGSENGLSAGISGSDPLAPVPETPTMAVDDPRLPEARQAVDAAVDTAQAIAAPFQMDFSGALPGEERAHQLAAIGEQRRQVAQGIKQLAGVDVDKAQEHLAGSMKLAGLLKQERELRSLNEKIFYRTEEGQKHLARQTMNLQAPVKELSLGLTGAGLAAYRLNPASSWEGTTI